MQTSEERKDEDVGGLVEGTDVNEASGEKEVPLESGVQVAHTDPPEEALEESMGLELGDTVEIHSNRADIETVKGLIYYIDETRISILEEGKSRKLTVFDMELDEDGVPSFLEEYELTGIDIKEKRLLPSFVAQRGMAKDMQVETFTSDGDTVTTYTIKTVDEENDTVTLVDNAGEELQLEFEFKGIPRDKSIAPFDILRVIEPPKVEPTIPNEAAAGEVEEFLDFEFLDEMEAPDIEEIAGIVQGIQKPIWEEIFSTDDQINDMLRDRIRELDPAAQRSAKRIRVVTRLVWNMLALRNDVTRYKGDIPVGRKPAAYNTLVELLEKTESPLAKKILAVAKSIYIDHSYGHYLPLYDAEHTEDADSVIDPQIRLHYLHDVITKGERYLETQLRDTLVEAELPELGMTKKIPRWITIWQGYFNRYFMTTTPLREDGDLKDIKFDTDFFRYELPTMETEEASQISGFPILDADAKTKVDESYLKKIAFSYLRALGPRYGRYGEGGLTHKIEDADLAEIKGYLLFPLQFIRDLGYIRSGILAYDAAYGSMPPKTMKQILDEAKTIVDIPEANKIISVNFDGSTLGNVEIADWLKGQALYGGGIGDLMPPLRSFGLLQAEFTLQQKLVLESKIAIYRSAVKKMLKEAREEIFRARKERKPIETFPLLSKQSMFEMFQLITSDSTGEPILKELLADFAARHPSYTRDDVSKFAYLYVYYPDLLINSLAQNPEVAKERLRAERDLFIQDVIHKLEAEKKLEDRGEPPRENPCQHVKDLNVKIRKIQDPSERMLALNKFVQMYTLKKEDHWLWCNNGEPPHHLLCEHEYLLLQEFLRPKEKEVIHKQIILTFGGGKFNGQYICRQCGQPISDFEYDTNVGFDDNGNPLDGRGVLVDEDAIEEEKLFRAVTAEDEDEEKVETPSEDDLMIYHVIAELAGLVGIFPDQKSYQIMIARVKNALALVPDRVKYAKTQKALKSKGKVATDYDVFKSRILVALCSAALLIDVQTHIPEYVVRYTLPGCAAPEFTGYPRDPDARKPDTGMEYLACAISSITHSKAPWDLTGYQSIGSSTERLKKIMEDLRIFTEQLAETSDVQQSIIDKKTYLLETFGFETAIGRPKDKIPDGFTPTPFIPTKELAAEAEAPVIAASAAPSEKVRAYIKQAHIYALRFGKYAPGTGITETSCCYTDLRTPGSFWNAKEGLPDLPPLDPPKGTVGSLLYLKMVPRPLERLFAKADASIMYRLFLRVCFRGPRIGQQHEPGYNNTCPWCDFVFPDDPRLPPPTRRYGKESGKQKKYDAEYESELKAKQQLEIQALHEAGIEDITTENFEELLTSVNRRSIIPELTPPVIPLPIDNLRGTLSLIPQPFDDFEELMRATLEALTSLPPDAKSRDVVNAFTPLSQKTVEMEGELRRRLGGEKNFELYKALERLNPLDLGEALRSYVLIPFQRILSMQEMGPRRFKPLVKPSATSDYSPDVFSDLEEAYKRHTSYLNDISKDIPKSDVFIKAKMREVVNRLSVVIPFFIKILRPSIVRGGQIATSYLQRSIVAGIFLEFIDPNHIPPSDTGVVAPRATLTTPALLPARMVVACLRKYSEEGLNYSEEQIREMIQDRIEKEKNKIMRDKSDMTPEQRKLDNLLQRYGMGKWAVGGTKAIWRYDPNQYVSEREAMDAAGITRFGPQMDVYEREGGYNVIQTAEDDA